MNRKYAAKAKKFKKKLAKRLRGPAKTGGPMGPVMSGSNIHYEIADKVNAIGCGGIGVIHMLSQWTGLIEGLDSELQILKRNLPYHDSDHVLNLCYNVLCGGVCLEDIESRREDVHYLDALGAERVPDPTTSGDYLRRFEQAEDVSRLMDIINHSRQRVWEVQPEGFLEEAYIDGDGTIASTQAECKDGVTMSYKGIWGYHPLIISLANTKEVLYVVNRPGNKKSSEGAAQWYDKAIELVRGHSKKICLRGDTDFSQTTHLDRWNKHGIRFIFGYDAKPNIKEQAESLPEKEWRQLERVPKYEIKTRPRRKAVRHKEQIVEEKGYRNIKLAGEDIAEFEYKPGACKRPYRMIVVRKNLTIKKGEKALIDDERYFFYITNRRDLEAEEIVGLANQRCDQENVIEQCKNGVNAMRLPAGELESNWAYMVIAILAWNLKAWYGLMMEDEDKGQLIVRMEFRRFLNNLVMIPAQIVKTGRRIVYRILNWNEWTCAMLGTWWKLKRSGAT